MQNPSFLQRSVDSFSVSRLDYEGHTSVAGVYQLPTIGFSFASLNQGHALDDARQSLCEGFIAALEEHHVRLDIVVIGDKWQQTYGDNVADMEKWPDLPAFIAQQHRQVSKVLLWLKAWDPEGLPAEECARNSAGLPITFDPTNPQFVQRSRRSIRSMPAADGYDADGFKIDFSAWIPSVPGITVTGHAWGMELMKEYPADYLHRGQSCQARCLGNGPHAPPIFGRGAGHDSLE